MSGVDRLLILGLTLVTVASFGAAALCFYAAWTGHF